MGTYCARVTRRLISQILLQVPLRKVNINTELACQESTYHYANCEANQTSAKAEVHRSASLLLAKVTQNRFSAFVGRVAILPLDISLFLHSLSLSVFTLEFLSVHPDVL